MQKGGAGMLEVTGPQRRRSRESTALGLAVYQERYTPETLTDGLVGKARTPNPDSAKKRAKAPRRAAAPAQLPGERARDGRFWVCRLGVLHELPRLPLGGLPATRGGSLPKRTRSSCLT